MHLAHVTTRHKPIGAPVLPWLKEQYADMEVSDVYGCTTDRCRLYGGRHPTRESYNLTQQDLQSLYEAGIGLAIPLQSTEFSPALYKKSLWFLDKHHKEGNKVILYSDEFRECVATDFPKYKTIASVIKNFTAPPDEVKRQLDLYDYVVIPTTMTYSNKRKEFSVGARPRLISFKHTACTQTCSSDYQCYRGASKRHTYGRGASGCKNRRPIYHAYNTELLEQEGFERFKYTEAWQKCR